MSLRPTRRQLLLGAAAALALPRRALAIGAGSRFRIGHLVVPGAGPELRAGALASLSWELDKRTSVDVERHPVPVTPGSGKLHRTPFLALVGDRAFPPLGVRELAALRRFLTFGGFLLVDSAEGRAGGAFDTSVRRLVGELFPRPSAGLEPLSPDHVIYKSFYLVDRPVGRLAIEPKLEAVIHDRRAVVVYSQNDLAGAWAEDLAGNHTYPCYPDGERQRELAYRLGVNIVMYALCLDYKEDQVHIPFILKRRKWKPE